MAEAQQDRPTSDRRDPVLDGVRGLAVLLVMFHHAVRFTPIAVRGWLESHVAMVAGEAWVGVDLFFVLSGFLISGILIRTRSAEHYLRNFYARRTLRIFPLYYAFVALFVLVLPLAFHSQVGISDLASHQAWYWLYVPNYRIFLAGDWANEFFDHSWSLAIEEQFYLVWPLVVLLVPPKRLLPVATFVAIGSAVCRAYLARTGHSHAAVRVFAPAHLDGLMMGAALAALNHETPGWLKRNWRSVAVILGGFGLVGRASASHYLHVSWDFSKDVLFVLWWSLVFSALVVVGIHVGPKSWVRRVLESRVLVFFGTYSYGIYLVHQPLFYCLSQVLSRHFSSASQSFLVLGLGGGGMSTVFAVLSYRYFETPFLRLKQRFSPEHHRVSNMPAVSA